MIDWIRHGETPGNRERRVQRAETPLSDRGLVQAERLAARLRDAGLVRLLSSDLARAKMTADAVGAATGLAPELHAVYQERNFGDLRGTLYADLEFDLFAEDVEPPAGETWSVFHARAERAWQHALRVAQEAGGPIAVVTHGLVLASVLGRHAQRDAGGAPFRFGNTSVSVTVPIGDHAGDWRLDLLDCTSHLDPEVADDAGGVSGI
jgi:broad specificity phosphatase PhoE